MAGRRVVPQQRDTGNKGSSRRRGPQPDETNALLPGIPMLRNSERGALKKCEFLWDLTYNQHLKPQRDTPALRFGSLIHKALAAYCFSSAPEPGTSH